MEKGTFIVGDKSTKVQGGKKHEIMVPLSCIFSAAAVHMTKICSIICIILRAAELRLNQDALLNKREWGIFSSEKLSENNKRGGRVCKGFKIQKV